MKQIFFGFLFLTLLIPGFFDDPIFVFASNTCYVDEKDGDEDGDGDKDDPFESIDDALDDGCEKIIVEKGAYSDNITINRNTIIEGKSRNDVTLSGDVAMKDGSKLKNVTVSGEGIDIASGADVEIKNVTIKNASIGINTTGNGKLTVKNALIYGNGKGMYIQKGKDVDITDTEIRDNNEEGIDIRANVDGEISGCMITHNGESGIEVILGKSELKIVNNSIKKNDASGIAMQYYKESSKIGAVKVKGNTITHNKDYGINCKVPSGGNPGVNYWSESTNMSSNKVYSNKDGQFSDTCFFSEETVSDATKTKKEQEKAHVEAAVKAQAQEQKKLAQEQKKLAQEKELADAEKRAADERVAAEQKKAKQEALRKKLQEEKNLQNKVNDDFAEVKELSNNNQIAWKKVEERFAFITFIIGPDYKEIAKIEKTLPIYEEKIASAKAIQAQITDDKISERINVQIQKIEKEQKILQLFIKEQKEEFSLLGWMFNREKKE